MFSSSKSASRTDRLPKIAKLTQQRAVSFKVYELEQKAKLKTYCPFLSADQIKNKIKDQWHNLAQEEKKKYTKIVLKSTPVKEKHATNMSLKTSKRGRKRKKGIENILSKRTKLDICATPEHVNTQKLRDFRTKHTEHYDNDFSGSSASQDSQLAPLYDWTMKGMATYQKCSSNIERVIPEIVDNSPCQQAGILKNRYKGMGKHGRFCYYLYNFSDFLLVFLYTRPSKKGSVLTGRNWLHEEQILFF